MCKRRQGREENGGTDAVGDGACARAESQLPIALNAGRRLREQGKSLLASTERTHGSSGCSAVGWA